jgi:hypothetical protein
MKITGVPQSVYVLFAGAKNNPKRIKMLEKLRAKIFKK